MAAAEPEPAAAPKARTPGPRSGASTIPSPSRSTWWMPRARRSRSGSFRSSIGGLLLLLFARPAPSTSQLGGRRHGRGRHRRHRAARRAPLCAFEVVVRDRRPTPVVIRNAPLLDDGTPMPTRYWLVGKAASQSREPARVARAACEQPSAPSTATTSRPRTRAYAAERDSAIPPGHDGPRPSGGVGGTRQGVKCLHAHYAAFLAGFDDPSVVGSPAELEGS